MRLRPRQGLLLGIAILAAASVVLEVALARTWAPLLGPHLALAVPGLALGGAALGAALAAALPALVARPALLARASILSGLAAAGTLAALLVTMHVKVPDAIEHAAIPLAAVSLSALLPFAFVGIALAAAVRHVPVLAGRIVFALFGGAALGAPLALGAMRASAPRACLIVIGAYAVASLVFYLGARGADAAAVRPRGSLVATFLLASAVLLAGDVGAPWLKLPSLRFAGLDKVEVQEWSGLGLTTVDKPQAGVSWIRTDGVAAMPLYDVKTAVPLGPDEMAYALHHGEGPVAIVGSGGGRDVRTALKYGQRDVRAIEVDPILVRALMLDRYKKTSGDVYDGPGVKVVLEDARGYLRRAHTAFRNIVLPMPESGSALAVGALAAEPTPLFTVEAFADFLAALAPEGTLVATRSDGEGERLLALAASALAAGGAADPAAHLYACSASRATTVLAKKTAIAPADLAQLRSFCRKNKMVEIFAPDQRQHRHHVEPGRAAETVEDPRPPIDDRPFFASVLPPAHWVATLRHQATAGTAQGLAVIGAELAVALLVLVLALGMPLAGIARSRAPRLRALVFFTSTGLAAAFAAAALLPRLGVVLGHPIYASTTSLPWLFVMVAIGGLVVGRVRASGAEAAAGVRAELLVAVLAIAAVALEPVVEVAIGLPFAARVGVAFVFLAPVGLLAGSLLALGARFVGAMSPELVAWCWAMATAGAFVGIAAATPLAMAVGFTAVLLAAGACALVAAIAVPRL